MNTRANIMYFLEHFCDLAAREHPEYVRMIVRDILSIIDAVTPEDGSGAANVKVVSKVLAALAQKSILPPATVSEIEACLKDRDTLPSHAVLSPIDGNAAAGKKGTPVSAASPQQRGSMAVRQSREARPDKRQIEQRIEEDRERHKRARESIWAMVADGDQEFERLWDEASEVAEDDYLAAEEDRTERDEVAAVAE